MTARHSIVAASFVLLAACAGSARSTSPAPATSTQEDTMPKIDEGYLTTADGARLYYRKLGSGGAVAIVPGAFFYGDALDELARSHTVITYDMRNRGRSGRVASLEQVSIQHDVADLEHVRAHFGVERFTPIGWSYLGLMVMLYALDHPARVERIVQLGPMMRQFGTEYPPELRAPADPAWNAELQQVTTSPLADPAAQCAAFWAVFRRSLVGDLAHVDRIPDPCVHENEWPHHLNPHFQALFGSLARVPAPSWDRFAALTVPVLTIHGTLDRQSPYGAGREWATHLPSARLLTIAGAAHMSWLDAPTVVMPAVADFLAGGAPGEPVRP